MRFNRFNIKRKRPPGKTITVLVMDAALWYMFAYIADLFPTLGILFTILTFYWIWMYAKGVDKQAVKFFYENKMGGKAEVRFFDDTIEMVGDTIRMVWQYKELKEIIATESDVYIKYTPLVTLCIKKTECPEGFLEFVDELKQQCGTQIQSAENM